MIDPKALEELDLASRAIERARVLLAGEDNNATAAAVPRPSTAEADVWRDLVERAHHLALCVFKGTTKADYERARHNAAVLANAIDHARQNEQNSAIAEANAAGEKAGITQAARSDARPSSSPSPAVRDVTLEALKLENEDLKAFIRGIGINCQRAAETLSQVASSALHPSVAEGRQPRDEKI